MMRASYASLLMMVYLLYADRAESQPEGSRRAIEAIEDESIADSPRDSEVEDKLRHLDEKLQYKLGQQVAFLRERIERIESGMQRLNDAMTLDWVKMKDGQHFKLFDRSLNWTAAEEVCVMYGGRLALINDQATNNLVADIVNRLERGSEVWLGLKTKTEMSSPNLKYTNFNDDQRIEGCATVDGNGKWKLRLCSAEKAFICEKSGQSDLKRLLY